MASPHYFEFLGSVWSLMPEDDRQRFGELWHGIEQAVAATYQKFAENNLNTTVQNLVPFSSERWLPYTFNEDNFVNQPAVLTSTQDLSLGVNLSTRYLLRIMVDNGLPLTVDIRGDSPLQTFVPEIVDKINAAFGYELARGIFEDTVLQLVSPTSGIDSKIEILATSPANANACEFVLGIDPVTSLPFMVPEFPWVYSSPYSALVSVPELQNAVRDESITFVSVEGEDHIVLNKKHICFKEQPPEVLWARKSLIDQENPWNNFGFLMDIYQKNSARYVTVLQGLWFAFWTGPRPRNVKISLYLLFGLPTAPEAGVITGLTVDTVELTGESGRVYTYQVPTGLSAEVTLGQAVEKFDPLVSGIDVFDKLNRPGFIEEEIGREGLDRFLTENATRGPGDTDETKALRLLEEHTFLPQISVDAFITPDINLGNVRTFLDAIKPLSKAYLFQVIVGTFLDELALEELVSPCPSIDVTPNLDSNQTTFISSTDLTNYETIDNEGLDLDSDVVLLQELVEIEVYSFGSLIDSFTA